MTLEKATIFSWMSSKTLCQDPTNERLYRSGVAGVFATIRQFYWQESATRLALSRLMTKRDPPQT